MDPKDAVVMVPKSLLEEVKLYIEDSEVIIDDESKVRDLPQIIKDGDMPDVYDKVCEALSKSDPVRWNPTPRTLERIGYLLDPSTLDDLLDVFQELGMPMGSDRWAEHCLTLLKQRDEEARALRSVMRCLGEAANMRDCANDAHWIARRQKLIEDHQRRSAERDGDGKQA